MKSTLKKGLLITGSVLALLILVLAVHIYIVTRPKAPDAYTRAMARIDIKQDIDAADANKITAWLYQQKGVDHVLVNPRTDIVIFTFFPVKTTANKIVSDFKSCFPYKAERFVPSEADLKGSCPVASTSFVYKASSYLKKIF
ncbi:MAG: hypothetical protein P4L51_14900 [Puia sp.]|nr:hypothetical protein [Puia sp.]